MKILTLLIAVAFSPLAFAQNVAQSTADAPSRRILTEGIYFGVEYMNLSELKVTSTYKHLGNNTEQTQEPGIQLPTAGISLGYNGTPDRGLGFSIGARALQSITENEFSTKKGEKYQMIIPELNATYAASRSLIGFIGINSVVFQGFEEAEKYHGQIGGQAGVALRLTKSLAMKLGYTLINEKHTDSLGEAEVEYEEQAGGFSSNIAYTF